MTVVAADGQYVRPVEVDEFRLSAAETIDVLVEPEGCRGVHDLRAVDGSRGLRARHARGARRRERAVPELDAVAVPRDGRHGSRQWRRCTRACRPMRTRILPHLAHQRNPHTAPSVASAADRAMRGRAADPSTRRTVTPVAESQAATVRATKGTTWARANGVQTHPTSGGEQSRRRHASHGTDRRGSTIPESDCATTAAAY